MDYVAEYRKYFGDTWADGLVRHVPEHMVGGMVRYIVHGIQPGHFLSAVISGDLFEALRRADDVSVNALRAYGVFFFNYAPNACFGSVDNVRDWIRAAGARGTDAAAET